MKKSCILTFHRTLNYGAILQTYALQKTLDKLDMPNQILDYRNKRLEQRYVKKTLFSEIKKFSIRDLAFYILMGRTHNKKLKEFQYFANKFLKFSKPLLTKEDLKQISKEYDSFIVGSDQVWNYKITDFDKTYFLDFIKEAKKNSYSASFGFDKLESHKKEYSILLNDFQNISVRELQGVNIVKKLISRKAEIHIDPTLLLNKFEWEKLSNEYKISKKYILVYGINGEKNMINMAKKLAKKNNYKIVVMMYSFKWSPKIKYEWSLNPQKFLSLFMNAEYIITNSFHGTAFAINFNKIFFTELQNNKHKVNSRLFNILTLFNLENRLITKKNLENPDTEINYNTTNKILEKERTKSLKYLYKIVRGN